MGFIKLGAISFLITSLSGCAIQPSPSGRGLIYTDVNYPIAATSNINDGKTGRSCAHNILGAVSVGDASTAAAMKDGGIKNVSLVDAQSFNVLGIYAKYCTIVTGN